MARPRRQTLSDAVLAQAAAQQQLTADAELARLRAEVAGLRSKYKTALEQIDREPDLKTIHSFLALVEHEKDQKIQAQALTKSAQQFQKLPAQ